MLGLTSSMINLTKSSGARRPTLLQLTISTGLLTKKDHTLDLFHRLLPLLLRRKQDTSHITMPNPQSLLMTREMMPGPTIRPIRLMRLNGDLISSQLEQTTLTLQSKPVKRLNLTMLH